MDSASRKFVGIDKALALPGPSDGPALIEAWLCVRA
jgi:hypothetical protein